MITDSIQSCISAVKQKQDALRSKQSFEEYQKTLASLSVECQKTELLEAIDDCGIALENGQLGKEGVQVFGSRTKQLQRDLTAAWKVCATHYADSVTGYLGIVQGLTDRPKEVDELKSRIGNTVNGDPSPASAKKLSADVAQANAIISRYSLKPEIESFLRKVAFKQATVADLTPTVISWLDAQNLLTKIKIAF